MYSPHEYPLHSLFRYRFIQIFRWWLVPSNLRLSHSIHVCKLFSKLVIFASERTTPNTRFLRNVEISLKTEKGVLDCYVISVLLHGSECWTISQRAMNKPEAAEMFYRMILTIPCTEPVNNNAHKRKNTSLQIKKRQLKFFRHKIRKEKRLIETGYIDPQKR